MDENTLTIVLLFALVVAVAMGPGGIPQGVPGPAGPSNETHPADGTPPPGSPGVPGHDGDVTSPEPTPPYPHPQISVSREDRLLLASLIRAEAEGEPFAGQVAVGATVLNRVKSPAYPDTVHEVIYQVDGGYWQYEVVQNGRISIPPDETSLEAADRAINGEDPSLGAIGFYNPAKTTNWWVLSRPVTIRIGNHAFYK